MGVTCLLIYICVHLSLRVCVKHMRIKKKKIIFGHLKNKINLQCINGKIHQKVMSFIKHNER